MIYLLSNSESDLAPFANMRSTLHSAAALGLLAALAAVIVALEFEETYSGNGKWSLSYLVSLKWLLWISLAALRGCCRCGCW
jgi:hypothetical protein